MKSNNIVLVLILLIAVSYFKPCVAQEKGPAVSEIEQVKAELMQKVVENQKKQEYRPKWQEDFKTMQMQANDSMAKNIKLDVEYKLLKKEELKLQSEVKERHDKNQDLSRKASEQQEMLDENKWNAKTASQARQFQESIAGKNKELEDYERKIQFLEQKIAVARLKLKLMGVEDYSDKLLAMQEERDLLEARIVSQTDKEKNLAVKIQEIKGGNKTLDPAVAGVRADIDSLRKEIDGLQRQERGMVGKSGPTPQEQIKILTDQKSDLLTENSNLKAKINKYTNSQKMGIENKRIKDLIEAMSAVDTANSGLDDEISYLKENIAILKVRVKKLEYQSEALDAIKGKNK